MSGFALNIFHLECFLLFLYDIMLPSYVKKSSLSVAANARQAESLSTHKGFYFSKKFTKQKDHHIDL